MSAMRAGAIGLAIVLCALAARAAPLSSSTAQAAPAPIQDSSSGAGAGTLGSAPRDAAEVARLAATWREALDLDLPDEILTPGAWIESRADADPRLAALYARALHAAGLDARAAAIAARGGSAPLVLVAARLALDSDDLPRARALLAAPAGSAQVLRFPEEDECYLLLGRALARTDELARAEPLLVEFVRRAPFHAETPQAWFLLVDCARARGDAALASRREESRARSAEWHTYYRARRLQARANPKEPLPRLGLAQLWLSAGEIDRARAEVERALELDGRFCRAIELSAEIERRAGRAEQAAKLCADALACDPALVEVHLTRARLARDASDAQGYAAHLALYRARGGAKEP